jgi:hypothetical protein
LINRLPSAKLDYKSPLEILFGRKINLDHLRVFGCTCFVHKNRLHKFDFTSIKIIFLGYSFQKKRYKCYDPKYKKLYISREVTFLENEAFYKVGQGDVFDKNASDEFLYPCVTIMETNEPRGELSNIVGEGTLEEESEASQTDENEEVAPLRRSTRQVQPSTRLRDYVTYSVHYSIQDYISYKKYFL